MADLIWLLALAALYLSVGLMLRHYAALAPKGGR